MSEALEQAPAGAGPPADGVSLVYVIGSLQSGGAERHVATVAAAFRREGWRVTVYALAGGPLQSALEAADVTVEVPDVRRGGRGIVSRLGRVVGIAWNFRAFLARQRPTIVHFFLPEAYLVGAPVAILSRVPVRVMSRRSLNLYQRGYPRAVIYAEMLLHRFMSAVLGNSRAVLGELRSVERVPASRLALIYNGVATIATGGDRRQAVRAALSLAPDTLTLVQVANFIPYKGHRDLIEALAIASPALPSSWRMLLIGRDDGIGEQIRTQAAAHGLTDHISFLGSREDVADLLAASDIGILASHQEGFSNAVLEGMAAGLPMVVTDVGGNAEAVLDGVTGLVVPARDPRRLAEAVTQLSQDRERRLAFGAAGRQRVADCFSQEQCKRRYDMLYRGLLTGRLPAEILPEKA